MLLRRSTPAFWPRAAPWTPGTRARPARAGRWLPGMAARVVGAAGRGRGPRRLRAWRAVHAAAALPPGLARRLPSRSLPPPSPPSPSAVYQAAGPGPHGRPVAVVTGSPSPPPRAHWSPCGRGGVLGPQAARPFARRQGANYNASVKSVSAQKLRCSIRLLVVRSQKKIFIAPLMQITGTFREPDQGRQSARLTLYIRDREAKLLMRSRLACTQRTDQWWSHDTSIIEIVPHHCGRSTLIAGPGSSQ
jgi:hypothetical protein